MVNTHKLVNVQLLVVGTGGWQVMKILLMGDNQLAITGDMFEIKRVMEQLTTGNQVDLLLRTECMTKINVVLSRTKEASVPIYEQLVLNLD